MNAARRAAPARGFSLVEILVVVALIAVASLLAVGVFGNGIERMQVRSAVRDVAANLRHARALAIATGRPQTFAIDPAARTWRAGPDRSGRLPERLQVEFTGAREVQPRPGEGAIVFFDDGASTGGRVTLVAGPARWNVDVAWLTGDVQVHRGEARR
ncbi:GspH/FimT family pseudopilin [Luteimonas sp. Y-2-2-4F]|nr:GspH/FimT family pseudopilin [Luteimonas sp. Y-2-2-4F]MCD9030519.1 GspH/FimT family pseudopilin [Luteimonas sp. Y-2-2-4F]